MAFAARSKPKRASVGQPDYQLASLDLSQKWLELVRNGQVEATVEVPAGNNDDGNESSPEEMLSVKYGVKPSKEDKNKCQEFVVQLGTGEPHEKIRVMNETLARLQSDPSRKSVQYERDGDFVAQLQLVRTLRPPPSPGFAEASSSEPPPYDEKTDSFVTGPLRLELRPLVGTVKVPSMVAMYDIYHNVSPADSRGHFLLMPTLSDSFKLLNWRGQKILPTDFGEMLHLASSVRPHGSLFLGFNSVGAGASQNHIHFHAWPSPPLPFLNEQKEESPIQGWKCYAASKVKSILDYYDLAGGKIEVTYLKYPLFCVQFSASKEHLDDLSKALVFASSALEDAPYNIGFLNRPAMDDDGNIVDTDDSYVDVYLFVRSKEISSVLPSLKLGISEAMGIFHAQTEEELEVLKGTAREEAVITEDHHDHHDHHEEEPIQGPMQQALEDISYEARDELWGRMKTLLVGLDVTLKMEDAGIDEECVNSFSETLVDDVGVAEADDGQ
ncbi:MAG: hypothetical protein SGBAC_006889 [Bacillariaceae sp.]